MGSSVSTSVCVGLDRISITAGTPLALVADSTMVTSSVLSRRSALSIRMLPRFFRWHRSQPVRPASTRHAAVVLQMMMKSVRGTSAVALVSACISTHRFLVLSQANPPAHHLARGLL